MSMKLALVMVGLPARGKTHIARRIARYLAWLGYRTKVFNVGNYRRRYLGSQQSHHFFDPQNEEGTRARARVAEAARIDMQEWLAAGGQVGIYDATNVTRTRRQNLRAHLEARGLAVVFIESWSNDKELVEQNILRSKLRMPDYEGVASQAAAADFRARISHYEKAYEPLQEDEGSFVRVIDVGRKLIAHRIQGFLPSRLVYFLMNLHVQPRSIWLTRHGQSTHNLQDRVGGDPGLSPAGQRYAQALSAYINGQNLIDEGLRVWTSTLRRTRLTAEPLGMAVEEWRELDEIDAGACDGMSYAEIRDELPEEFEDRRRDKLAYRYPRGESYLDVIRRMEPAILELEREKRPVLVVAHQAVLRALYAYLMDRPLREVPYFPIPLHTIIQLTPVTYGCDERRIELTDRPQKGMDG